MCIVGVLGWLATSDCLAQSRSVQQVASPNFRVFAPTVEIAQKVADVAEEYRKSLAITWFGHRLPRWANRCNVHVKLGKSLGAGGATKFKFDRGEVYDWDMRVQGSLERVLDSVIPHEVNHTILACYFRRPVPRWADEGAATLIEHVSEKERQLKLVRRLVQQGRRIPVRILLNITQYPRDANQVMALYAEGFSLTEYLIQQRGHRQFLLFLNDAHHRGWDAAVKAYYKLPSIEALERGWMNWVIAGQPRLNLPKGQLLATGTFNKSATSGVVRSQNPDSSPAKSPGHSTHTTREILSTNARTNPSNWTGSIRFEPVSAPPPRSLTRQPAISQVAIKNEPSDVVQPLALVRIDRQRSRDLAHSLRTKTTASIDSRPDLAPPVVSEEAAFGKRLRETRLRSDAQPQAATQFLDWAQFPTARE
jgi:hypothetical protein